MGSHWLVPALFEHFERIGDIQMVAMMSCVLLEANHEGKPQKIPDPQPGQSQFPVELSSVASTVQNKSQMTTPASSAPRETQPIPPHTSARSSSEIWRVDSTPPYSTGTTPPVVSRPRGIAADRKVLSQNVSIAASPEQSQPRSGSGFGSVLASSLSRSFTFGPSSASPPAHTLSRKKPSAEQAGRSSGPSTDKSTPVPEVYTPGTEKTQSDAESERPLQGAKPTARFKVTFKNKSAFDGDDDSAPDSLLDRNKEWLYRSYRGAYAELLSIWDLPVQQSEVLKIGAVAEDAEDMQTSQYWGSHSSKMTSFREPMTGDASTTGFEGLDFQRHCANCGHALKISIFTPSPVVPDTPSKRNRNKISQRCPNCKPRQPLPTKLPCVICGEAVEGMLIPCLSCGHVSCFECHNRWFLQNDNSGDDGSKPDHHHSHESSNNASYIPPPSCPSGCGCLCSEHIAAKVSMPAWEPPAAVSPRVKETRAGPHRTNSHDKQRHRRRQSEPAAAGPDSSGTTTPTARGAGQNQDDLDVWQAASPFASLARGMGGGLSQGLRPKDDRRKNRSVAIAMPKGKWK